MLIPSLLTATFLSLLSTEAAIENPYTAWEEYFDHYTFLRPADDYRLYWKITDNDMVEIGLEVETIGWIGFGISPDNTMGGSDIIMGWIDDNNKPYLQRRHSVSNDQRYPVFDEDLSHDLTAHFVEDGITRLHFKRQLFPCADEENPFVKQIVMGTSFVIFAFNDNNPTCNGENDIQCSPAPHNMQSMGSQSINFFSGESTVVEMPEQFESFDFLMTNYSVPAVDTTYHCKFIEIPNEIIGSQHMIRYDPVIQSGNEAAVHHLVLYWCKQFDTNYTHFEANCNDFANMADFAGKHCGSDIPIAAWAVGASDFYFPSHVGYPISGKIYALLEIHYDNPNEISNIIDSSGVRIYWTPELRKYESGHFFISAQYESTFVPGDTEQPMLNSFHSAPECTQNSDIDPIEGINIFVGLLHSHTIGVAMKLRHIRNNVELTPLLQNDNYDFNYQQWIQLPNEVKIYPGDEFICECVYDNTVAQQYGRSRVYPTYGGQSTRDEMCVCTMYYYPRSNFSFASSIFTDEQFEGFFQTAIDNQWFNGTTKWYNNSQNQDTFYYDSNAEGSLQHYMHFQARHDRTVICAGCVDFTCEDYIVPEARDGFQALSPDDFGHCLSQSDEDEKVLSDTQIIIVSVAAGVALLLIVIIFVICCKRKRKADAIKKYENMEDIEQNAYGTTTTK